jgi:hypothetical protein
VLLQSRADMRYRLSAYATLAKEDAEARLPENFEPCCLISFHGSITRDERKIVLDCLPDEHPVKGISVPSQKRKMIKGRSDLNS